MADHSGRDDRRKVVHGILSEASALLETVRGSDATPVLSAADMIVRALNSTGKVLVFGNGGSAADAQHIAAELVGKFQTMEKALYAIALTTNTSKGKELLNIKAFVLPKNN